MVRTKGLCEICSPKQWKTISTDMLTPTGYPVYGANGEIGFYSEYNHKEETLLVTCRGATCGTMNICRPYSYVNGNAMALDDLSTEVDINFLYYYLLNRGFDDVITGSAQPQIVRQSLEKVSVTYPNIEKQKEIVHKLNHASNLISLRKQQLAKLDELVKARFVELFGDSEFNTMQWPTKKLSELCDVGSSKRIYQNEQSTEGIPFLRISDLNERIDNIENTPELFIPINKYNELKENGLVPTVGDILVTSRGTLGRCYIVRPKDEFYFQDGMISWLSDLNNQITSLYLSQLFAMTGIQKQIASLQAGSTVAYLSISMLKRLDIMLPPLALQNQFAAFVEQTDKSKLSIQQSLDKLETLKKSLMQKYFG